MLIVDRMAKHIKDWPNNVNTSTQGQLVNGQAECENLQVHEIYNTIHSKVLYVLSSEL